MSSKRKADLYQRAKIRERVLERDENRCQAGMESCTRHATDVHELKSRARGGDWLYDETNMIALCRSCHSFITQNPAWAEANGFAIPSWGEEAEYRAAERARMRYYWGMDAITFEDDEES
jgi:hypothetical protein